MEFTRQELESAHLVVVVDDLGLFKWSTKRSNAETARVLRAVAEDIERNDEPPPDPRRPTNGYSP